jgi:methylated-DNA-[protein]-cysteine S-methyltransferase
MTVLCPRIAAVPSVETDDGTCRWNVTDEPDYQDLRETPETPPGVVADMTPALFRSTLETPVGTLQLAVNEEGELVEILLPNRKAAAPAAAPAAVAEKGMQVARDQLLEYFRGTRRTFDLTLKPAGSPFERQVWAKLLDVPYGATTSYGAIAAGLGLLNGARAVGRANGSNPIPIVIPCHRVIGSDGSLTGYGGGLPLKRTLLELEGAIAPPEPLLFSTP